MRAANRQAVVTSSVWNRLQDDNPRDDADDGSASSLDLRRFKQAVACDLDALLNARCVDPDEDIERYPHARHSMINFGIIDLSSLSLLDPDDRALLRDKIRLTIERHEPRLSRVRVTLDVPDNMQRMLRFRVDAVLKVHPNKPPVSFDAMLQLSSNAYQVEGN
ncbi:type VI secretion system baseplate subunit TssE [Noviherbaspirillum denitrificans]|uniref:Type VI secretion protein n=1 Tax=Noviherbaspirillum denitrificans TaxID=1968433 RepID=A0A254T8U1_9BURK|nr:type VI secretion system baseplate subunit TssE [Noviherbaspirillum denitrificans]OWW19070.1 type VI secretion protein [Noviherbaspirillum denitrificans]